MEPQSISHDSATGLYDRVREETFLANSSGDKSDLSLGMSQLGSGCGGLSDALDRVYPIRSVIEIDCKNADSGSSSSNGQPILGEHGSTGDAESTLISEQRDYGWEDPGWATKIDQTDDNTETPYITTRFTHRMTQGGHMVVTGVAGAEKMQRCEVSSTSFRYGRSKG